MAGRAGRTKKRGKVLIQTYNPYHQILQQVSTNSFEEMATHQLEDRFQYKYPPYYRLIKITFKDRNLYITAILIKTPKGHSLIKTKKYINTIYRSFIAIKEFSSVRILIDVDNYKKIRRKDCFLLLFHGSGKGIYQFRFSITA